MQPADSHDKLGSSTPTLTEREVAREVVRCLRATFKGKLKVECETFRPDSPLGGARTWRGDIVVLDGKDGLIGCSLEVRAVNIHSSKGL